VPRLVRGVHALDGLIRLLGPVRARHQQTLGLPLRHDCGRVDPRDRECRPGRRRAVTAHRRSPAKQETRARTGVVEFAPKGHPRWRDSYRRQAAMGFRRAVVGTRRWSQAQRRCLCIAGVLQPSGAALLPATHRPGASVAKAPASIRLEGPDAGVAPALLTAHSATDGDVAEMLAVAAKEVTAARAPDRLARATGLTRTRARGSPASAGSD
jgi:hypothetical protein